LKIAGASAGVTPGAAWRRFFVSANPGTSAESVAFEMEIPAGGSVELFGAQVEAQVGMSDYKKTGARGGVYTARFASDEFNATATGMDSYDAAIRIVATKG
jgi:hypothetical protein